MIKKEILEKYSINWENRYNPPISLDARGDIRSYLFDKFKVREREFKLEVKNIPQFIDEEGNKTGRLLAGTSRRDGHIIEQGYDENGWYVIFQPRTNEFKKLEEFVKINDKLFKLSQLSTKQHSMLEPKVEGSKISFDKVKKEIDELFIDIFDYNNELTDDNKNIKNPFPRIFSSEIGFDFFKRLQSEIKSKYKIAEYSFIYRMLLKDSYINSNVRVSDFIEWININFEPDLERLKTLNDIETDNRIRLYNIIKSNLQ